MTFVAGTLDTTTYSIGTEHSVATVTTTGAHCQGTIDAKNLVNGDTLLVRIYVKVDTGETKQLAWSGTWSHALAEPLIFTPMIGAVGDYVEMTVTQTAGTGRAIKSRLSAWS